MQTAEELVAAPAGSAEVGGLLGRVMSLSMLASIGLAPVSLAAAGALVDLGAATLMYGVAGAIVLLAAIAEIVTGVPAAIDGKGRRSIGQH